MVESTRISKENLSAQIYRVIRKALIDGQYQPGDRLRIAQLADELGTSITPVREALFRLVSEQALNIKTATAIYVPNIDTKKIREIQLIRIELEGLAAAKAAEIITDKQIATLEKKQEKFIKAAETNPKKASEYNRDFHFEILKIADMPALENIVENMWVQMGPLLNIFHATLPPRQLSSSSHPHYRIIHAFKNRDSATAKLVMQEDIQWSSVIIDWMETEDGQSSFMQDK